jgi:hypothetical protein
VPDYVDTFRLKPELLEDAVKQPAYPGMLGGRAIGLGDY